MFENVINICCTVDKNSPDKKHYSSKHTTLEEVGLELAHTVTTHEPNLGVHHANVVIQIREVDKEYVENTIVKSRAEQSRAEQSRAEQLNGCIRLGNLNGKSGGSFAGQVYSKDGQAPTLTDMQGGGRQPHIVEVEKYLLDYSMSGFENDMPRIYEEKSPTITSRIYKEPYQILDMRKVEKMEQKIKIRQATKQGFIECEVPGVCDLNYADSTTRRGRVIEGGASISDIDNGEYP